MVLDLIVNYATLIAYIAFTGDILFQISHILKRKSSADLSLSGCFVRLAAGLILLVKFFTVNDIFLIIGQSIFSATYLIYFSMLLFYRK